MFHNVLWFSFFYFPVILVTEHDGHQLLKVIVSHIEDPGEFYVQYSGDHHSLTVLMTQLAEHCDDNPTAVKFTSGMSCFWNNKSLQPNLSHALFVYLAKPGLICAAKYQEDDLWYRAEILDTLQPTCVQVKYTDFGNREWLNCERLGCGSLYCIWWAVYCVKRLCVLPSEMISDPPYCHHCSLNNLYPVNGSEWNMSLISRFKGIAMDTEVQMKVKI